MAVMSRGLAASEQVSLAFFPFPAALLLALRFWPAFAAVPACASGSAAVLDKTQYSFITTLHRKICLLNQTEGVSYLKFSTHSARKFLAG